MLVLQILELYEVEGGEEAFDIGLAKLLGERHFRYGLIRGRESKDRYKGEVMDFSEFTELISDEVLEAIPKGE